MLLRPLPRLRLANPASVRTFSSVAKLTLIGRLTADPEEKTTKSESKLITYTIACNNYSRKTGPTTSFFQVTCFGPKQQVHLANLKLKKGMLCYVEADVSYSKVEAGNAGEARKYLAIRHGYILELSHKEGSEEEGLEEEEASV